MLYLVYLGVTSYEVQEAFDRCSREGCVALRAVQDPDECGPLTGDDRRHTEHLVIGH